MNLRECSDTNSSPITYALLSDSEFSKLTLNEFSTIASSQMSIIRARLKLHEGQSLDQAQDLSNKTPLETPLIDFYKMSEKEISKYYCSNSS